jgi:ABC-2 type transport system ATP-binding protein
VCDYLVVLVGGRIALSGDVDEIRATHHLLTGPQRDASTLPANQFVLESSQVGKQSTLLVRTTDPILDPSWTVTPLSLDDIVLAYMKQARDGAMKATRGLAVAS